MQSHKSVQSDSLDFSCNTQICLLVPSKRVSPKIYLPLTQDVAWASSSSKTGIPLGQRCLHCAEAVSRAYPFQEWNEICSQCDASASFKAEVAEAVRIWRKQSEQTWPCESFSRHIQSGYSVEAEAMFWPERLFEDTYGFKPAEAGLAVEALVLEPHGKPVTGVFLQETDAAKPVRVKVFSTFLGDMDVKVLDGKEALRPGLAAEMQTRLEAPVGNKWTKGVQALQKNKFPHASEVRQLRKEWLDKQRRREEEKAQVAALTQPIVGNASDQLAEEDEAGVKEEPSESEDEPVDHVGKTSLLYEAKPKAKGKAGPKDVVSTAALRIRGKMTPPSLSASAAVAAPRP